jgi:hypothetical protein
MHHDGTGAHRPPPTLLEIEPACPLGNKDVLEARMIREPGTGFQTVMTAEIVGNNEKVPFGIVRFDCFEQRDVVLGIARSGTARDFLAITHSQRPIDPHLVVTTTVLQRSLDAMTIG